MDYRNLGGLKLNVRKALALSTAVFFSARLTTRAAESTITLYKKVICEYNGVPLTMGWILGVNSDRKIIGYINKKDGSFHEPDNVIFTETEIKFDSKPSEFSTGDDGLTVERIRSYIISRIDLTFYEYSKFRINSQYYTFEQQRDRYYAGAKLGRSLGWFLDNLTFNGSCHPYEPAI